MSVVRFQCPNCQAPLRLENRALFVGRAFDCPDCRETLLIEAQGSTGVSARLTTPVATKVTAGAQPTAVASRQHSHSPARNPLDLGVQLQPRTSWNTFARRPALLGWGVAAVFAVTLFAFVYSGDKRPSRDTIALAPTQASGGRQPPDGDERAKPLSSKEQAAAESKNPENLANDLTPQPAPGAAVAVAENHAINDSKPPQNPVGPVRPANEPLLDAPIEPPVEQPRKETAESIDLKLRQKILRFEQPQPVAFVKLLDDVEALAGVSIVWDLQTVDEEQLQKPVTLKLQQTTVGEILDALLTQVGLERRVVAGQIELRPVPQAVK